MVRSTSTCATTDIVASFVARPVVILLPDEYPLTHHAIQIGIDEVLVSPVVHLLNDPSPNSFLDEGGSLTLGDALDLLANV